MNVNSSLYKETLTSVKSQRSLQRPQSQIPKVPVDGVVETSIEQLSENVWKMHSPDQSTARQDFASDGQESRLDLELHLLVGDKTSEVEIMEVMHGSQSSTEASSRKGSSLNAKKSENLDEIQSAGTSSVPPEKSHKASNSQINHQTLLKSRPKGKSPPEKPPTGRRNDKLLRNLNRGVIRTKKSKNLSYGWTNSQNGAENLSRTTSCKLEMGQILLKQASDLNSSGDNPQKALELALQAMELFEKNADGKPSLDLVWCLHVIAAIYCSLGQYNEAIPILQHAIEIPVVEEGQEHALAKFASHMQLGDTYAMLGQLETSIMFYTTGLEVQRQVLGEKDPRVGETCRLVAEAHVQVFQFDEAERLCQMAVNIHKENDSAPSLEEAADRRLMALLCEINGDYEAALEHLVLASIAMVANGQEVASVDCSIGDTYLSLCRYDEAMFAYEKALTAFKSSKGESHPDVGSVFVRLADLYSKTGNMRKAKSYCESALKIYEKPGAGACPEEIASGLTNVSAIFESMYRHEKALKLLHKALEIYNDAPGEQSTIAGIEAQIGIMYYMMGDYAESYKTFKNAISKLHAIGEKKSALCGIVLNQMGLACAQRYALGEAIELFEEAKNILEQEYGPYHPETLGVYSNLSGTYDAVGRLDDAIELLDYVVAMREEKLGTANADVDDEKRRLGELLKVAGRDRSRKAMSLENLLDASSCALSNLVNRGLKTKGWIPWNHIGGILGMFNKKKVKV